jgi:hypothetical protein
VKITLKRNIRFNGQEYSDPNQLPPEVRAAYEKAMKSAAVRQNIVINGQELATDNEATRRLCDDILSVIENNGEVTLPNIRGANPLLTKRQLLFVVLFALGLAAIIALRLAE